MRTLATVSAELPLSVLGLLALAHSQYDANQDNPHWAGSAGYGITGHGVSTGLAMWTVTQDATTLADGRRVDCVRLTKREGFHTSAPEPPVDYLFPFEGLRGLVAADLAMAVEGD